MSLEPVTPSPAPPPPSATPPTATPLEYDRTPDHVTRGQFRVLLILMFINTVAIVGYVALPGGSAWVRQAWRDFENKRAARAAEQRKLEAKQKRVADFRKALPGLASMRLPTTYPIYTEDPLEAASLLASDTAYATVPLQHNGMPRDLWQPAVERTGPAEAAAALNDYAGGASSVFGYPARHGATIVVHARKNSAGADRLVWCTIDGRQVAAHNSSGGYDVTTRRALRARLINPGTETDPPALLHSVDTEFEQDDDERAKVKRDGGEPTVPQTFKIFAGEPHIGDPTRVTIRYQINGTDGTFVVRVTEGDRLLVEPAAGRIVERSGNSSVKQVWDPSAPPALRVSETGP